MVLQQHRERIANGQGFIAALDQSGGSTPKALKKYGIGETEYANDDEMFDLIHDMRSRIIKADAFNGERIIGAILFEKTMDDTIEGKPTADYLWDNLKIVSFLKVDKGLADKEDGVQLMNPIRVLDELCQRARKANVFGTKMRSVIHEASESGIKTIVDQQFEIGKKILSHELMPIIEPEVNIHAPDKAECEEILHAELLKHLEALPDGQQVMLKLTLPEKNNLYKDLVEHDKVLKVVALSGGYDLKEACSRLSKNDGMIASFSRALTNNLSVGQSDEEFNDALQHAVNEIYEASVGKESKIQAA